jgi:hypothetical protein
LHAVEQLDHRDEAGGDVDLVGDVRLVGRDDGDAEGEAEAGGEDDQPDQWAHQRGKEAPTLVEKAQPFAPDDALQTAQVPDRHKSILRAARTDVPFRACGP